MSLQGKQWLVLLVIKLEISNENDNFGKLKFAPRNLTHSQYFRLLKTLR